jgi:hypothetical protein
MKVIILYLQIIYKFLTINKLLIMKTKLCFMKLSVVMLMTCFLSSQYLYSQIVTKEKKRETISTNGVDKKTTNTSNRLITKFVYFGNAMPAGYVNKPLTNKIPNNGNICSPCAIPNNEADIPDNGTDVTNGGCDFPPQLLYTPINLGETRCGRINGYLVGSDLWRDIDFYKLTLSVSTTVYFSAYSNFYEGGILSIGYEGCPTNYNNIVYDYFINGIPNTISATLPAGTYLFEITSQNFGPGIGGDYMINVSDVAPGLPSTWCNAAPTSVPTLTEWGLIIFGLALFAVGSFYIVRRKRITS